MKVVGALLVAILSAVIGGYGWLELHDRDMSIPRAVEALRDRQASDRGGSNTTESPDGPLTVDLGASFDVGGLTLSDTKIYQLDDLEALGQSRPPRGVYIVFFAEVANSGSKGYKLNSAFQKLHIGGKEYEANPFLGTGSGSVFLEPGFAGSEIVFIFDVPMSSMADYETFAEKTYVEVTSLDFDAPGPRKVNVRLPSVEEPLSATRPTMPVVPRSDRGGG